MAEVFLFIPVQTFVRSRSRGSQAKRTATITSRGRLGAQSTPAGGRFSLIGWSHRRRYILVHTEEIGRIVLGLELRKSRVIVTVGAAGTLLALVAEVVNIGGAREIRLPCCEELSRPVDVSWRIGGVGPAG